MGLFLAVHLLLAFNTFYSVVLFTLQAYCHHLRAAGTGIRCERSASAGGAATAGQRPHREGLLLPLLVEIASFADGDNIRQTNAVRTIEPVFLLVTSIAWSIQGSINTPNVQ